MSEHRGENYEHEWQQFAQIEALNDQMIARFKMYLSLLVAWNEKINLTTITQVPEILRYHFQDSLALKHGIDVATSKSIADIGSGAGFPGIPLAIVYPHLSITLIEVQEKKNQFLQCVIRELGLANVIVCNYDWRTFLRKTTYDIQVFCARASLQPKELVRMFAPTCYYQRATIVYWASTLWKADQEVNKFVVHDVAYLVGSRTRRLIVMRRQNFL